MVALVESEKAISTEAENEIENPDEGLLVGPSESPDPAPVPAPGNGNGQIFGQFEHQAKAQHEASPEPHVVPVLPIIEA